MTDEPTITGDDWGKLVLRVAVGGLMLFHGVDKATAGIEGITSMVEAQGLPSVAAYGVYVGEILAPLLLLAGLLVRPAALILFVNMLVAVYLAHSDDLLGLGGHGGYALELQAFYTLGALSLLISGGGRLGLGRRG